VSVFEQRWHGSGYASWAIDVVKKRERKRARNGKRKEKGYQQVINTQIHIFGEVHANINRKTEYSSSAAVLEHDPICTIYDLLTFIILARAAATGM